MLVSIGKLYIKTKNLLTQISKGSIIKIEKGKTSDGSAKRFLYQKNDYAFSRGGHFFMVNTNNNKVTIYVIIKSLSITTTSLSDLV